MNGDKDFSAVIKERAIEAAWEERCGGAATFLEHVVEVERRHRCVLEKLLGVLESQGTPYRRRLHRMFGSALCREVERAFSPLYFWLHYFAC